MRTKIIASIGPSSENPEILLEMVKSGVTCFRINFSHGNPETWKTYVDLIREVEEKCEIPIAIMGDLKGPSVRVGKIKGTMELQAGDTVRLSLRNEAYSEENVIPLPVKEAFQILDVGDTIVSDDGRVIMEVIEKESANEFVLKAITPVKMTSNKSVVIKGKEVPLPAIGKEDKKSLEFALRNGFDIIGLSYVKRAEELRELREILDNKGASDVKISAKIEVPSAIQHLDEVINETDFVVIARGDLGMHFSLEELPKLQKMIATRSMRLGKPFVVATQLLGSMMESSVPTRSEIVDIVVAISEGADALMFTGETSVGKYPLEVIKWASKVINRYSPITKPPRIYEGKEIRDNFALGVLELSESINAKLLVYTKSGRTALRLAKERPKENFYAASNSMHVLRKLSILWGVIPIKVKASTYEEGLEEAFEKLKGEGLVTKGDLVVLTYGMQDEKAHVVRIEQVS